MRISKFLIALAASLLFAGSTNAAQGYGDETETMQDHGGEAMEEDWPPFGDVDIDDDGLISPAEAQQVEGLENHMEDEGEEGFMRPQQYDELREEQGGAASGYPGPTIDERKGADSGGDPD